MHMTAARTEEIMYIEKQSVGLPGNVVPTFFFKNEGKQKSITVEIGPTVLCILLF